MLFPHQLLYAFRVLWPEAVEITDMMGGAAVLAEPGAEVPATSASGIEGSTSNPRPLSTQR